MKPTLSASHQTVQLIGAFKLIKGLLLLVLALGVFKFLNSDLESTLTRFVHRLNVDPGSKYFRELMTRIGGFSRELLNPAGREAHPHCRA